MQGTPDVFAEWPDESYRRRKFAKHGARLRLKTVDDYDASARETIRDGLRFTYSESDPSEDRVGYFDSNRRRLTALSGDETVIVNHFRATENYVRHLENSDYP